ncbi:hypothetical protein H5410_037067 [Solanum commersonii]|uniref:Uncharacterized protein n=1 Tax=Solanum commersonii TaxID=4109 RepID=A0A9J5Y589_SOLCO|nr:hypothetical protein H5410_037067 [Solanum commersonii]
MLKDIQYHLHLVRKRAWKHRIILHHFDRAIPEMEQAYLHASLRSALNASGTSPATLLGFLITTAAGLSGYEQFFALSTSVRWQLPTVLPSGGRSKSSLENYSGI